MKTNNNFQHYLSELDKFLELYLVNKAPSLPENAKEIIVKYGPYVSLFFLVVSVIPLLGLFGLSSFLIPFSPVFSFGYIFVLAMFALQIYAFKGLVARDLKAWRIMYYIVLLNAVFDLLRLDLVGLIISSLISFYILFQIKPLYR